MTRKRAIELIKSNADFIGKEYPNPYEEAILYLLGLLDREFWHSPQEIPPRDSIIIADKGYGKPIACRIGCKFDWEIFVSESGISRWMYYGSVRSLVDDR